jgi:hypothetical protein
VVEVVTTHGLAERRTRFWKLVQIGHVPTVHEICRAAAI